MGFASLRFFHYRNIVDGTVPVNAPDVFLIGENGQGKTNFLEAVYLLSYGGSFRSRTDDVLVNHAADAMAVEGEYHDAESLPVEVTIAIEGGRKSYKVNGSPVKDRGELLKNVPCVVFCHGDIEFVQGGPSSRRRYFDQTALLVDPAVLDDLRLYQRALKSRNAALKEHRTDLLDVYDEQIVTYGERIMESREKTVRHVNEVFAPAFEEVNTNSTVPTIHYRPSWKDNPREQLRRTRDRDLTYGTTGSGPHRDRFAFSAGGADYVETASTGQIRLCSLILRAAQAFAISTLLHRDPVLLLDDVLLELDPKRRSRFMTTLPAAEQRFFTFLPDEHFRSFAAGDTLTLDVENGRITPR